MKKRILCVVAAMLLLTACSSSSKKAAQQAMNENAASYSEEIRALKDKLEKLEQENDALKKSAQEEANAMNDSAKPETLRLGETWKVPGLFTLTINSVTSTTKRNEYAEKKPAQVVIINYTYENLGFQGDSQDLYITPERVVDAEKSMGFSYPIQEGADPIPTPIGAKMENATSAHGLLHPSKEMDIYFSVYESNGNKHAAVFRAPITEAK